jgi:hypothetical protein
MVIVRASGAVIHRTAPLPKGKMDYTKPRDQANKLAEEWLDANYPDWKDLRAYWDVEIEPGKTD